MWRSFKELFSCIQIWPILFNSNVHILRIKNCICWNMSLFYKLKKKTALRFCLFFSCFLLPMFLLIFASQVPMSSCHLLMEVQSLPRRCLYLNYPLPKIFEPSEWPLSSSDLCHPSKILVSLYTLDLRRHQYENNSINLLHNNKWQTFNPSFDVCIFKEDFW